MPCTFELDAAARLRVHSYTGIVDDAVTIAAYTALVETPGYRNDVNDLVDMTHVDRLEVTAEAMMRVISLFAPIDALGVRTKLAIVAPNDLAYGVGRMYEMLRGEDTPEVVQVFRAMDDARHWIALP